MLPAASILTRLIDGPLAVGELAQGISRQPAGDYLSQVLLK